MAVKSVKKEPAKSTEAETTADASAATPKKRGKLLKIMIIFLILASGIGGGAFWYIKQDKSGAAAEAKPEPAKPPLYVVLEAFTVNLQIEDHPQFLQTGLSLKVSGSSAADALKLHMPEVRDGILLLLSSRKPSELLTPEGKRKLSGDIVKTVNAILSPDTAASKSAPAPAPAPAPAKKTDVQTPASADASTPESGAAEEQQSPNADATPAQTPAPAKAAQPPVLSVLFTSFIVQ